jgi:hypothetical protein
MEDKMVNLMVNLQVQKDKKGRVEIKPDFPEYGVYFHPIPSHFQNAFNNIDLDKILVDGYFGKCKDTGKKDVLGKRIFIKPFIVNKIKIKTIN